MNLHVSKRKCCFEATLTTQIKSNVMAFSCGSASTGSVESAHFSRYALITSTMREVRASTDDWLNAGAMSDLM